MICTACRGRYNTPHATLCFEPISAAADEAPKASVRREHAPPGEVRVLGRLVLERMDHKRVLIGGLLRHGSPRALSPLALLQLPLSPAVRKRKGACSASHARVKTAPRRTSNCRGACEPVVLHAASSPSHTASARHRLAAGIQANKGRQEERTRKHATERDACRRRERRKSTSACARRHHPAAQARRV